MTTPAACPIVFTRTGSWILSQCGILVLTISNSGVPEGIAGAPKGSPLIGNRAFTLSTAAAGGRSSE
jgi:hypothetical protein